MSPDKQFHKIDTVSTEVLLLSLTNRQIQIIKQAAKGLTNKEIASQLNIDEKTCKKHRENAYKKLNISGKEEIRVFLRWAKENIK